MLNAQSRLAVGQIIAECAETIIMPTFGRLTHTEIHEKSPGEIVTDTDLRAERFLTDRLTNVLPGSLVVGEESYATKPSILTDLLGAAPVWIIDPIDGTENFVAHNPRFTVLVALAVAGELQASWIHAPALGTVATAHVGGGAYIDGHRIHLPDAVERTTLKHLDVAVPQQRWWTPSTQTRMNSLSEYSVFLSMFDTSGIGYLDLAAGRRTAMVLPWESVCDHAAGVLLYTEAGGVVDAADGTPFTLAGNNDLPLVAAPNYAIAHMIHATMDS